MGKDGVLAGAGAPLKPDPLSVGLKAPPKATAKCLSGKMLPRTATHAGMSSNGAMNTFDTNASGNSVALVTAGVASLLGTMAATISPNAENAATPTMKVTTAAGAVRPKTSTPKKATPAPTMIATARIAPQID